MVFMSLPAGQLGADQPREARTVDFEILEKCLTEKGFFRAVMNMRVPEIEPVLAVGVGVREFGRVEERFIRFVLFIQRRSRIGGIKHELVKIGTMADRMVDDPAHVFRPVVFHADDG